MRCATLVVVEARRGRDRIEVVDGKRRRVEAVSNRHDLRTVVASQRD